MKISILSHNLSNNCLGRAYILAKMLSKKFDVEIIGPKFSKNIWKPVSNDKSIKYKVIDASLLKIRDNLSKIDGDIIYAIKPMGASYGYALLKKFIKGTPVILDEDDWDFGIFLDQLESNFIKNIMQINLTYINNPLFTYILGKLAFMANEVTVSSTFLQKKFGGIIIPHARDINNYKINPKETKKLKKKYNPSDKKVIMFNGTVRKHKGIDLIVNAIDRLDRDDILFIIVGIEKNQNEDIPEREYILTLPPQNFANLSHILSISDLIVLPQKKSKASLGQIPAKLFDAMAMGKPIISSYVSDIPFILENCGLIFEPDNDEELSLKIDYILNNPQKAKELGRKAYKKFISHYSFEAVEEKLFDIFERNK